jgi:acetylornithine/N-succinyldiaminopimelate aminotransferase
LAMAVGNAVLDVILADGFLDRVQRMAALLRSRLEGMVTRHGQVLEEVRGAGLLLGLKCVVPNTELIEKLRQAGLLTVGAGDNVVRLLPPLIIDEEHIEAAVDIVDRVCGGWSKSNGAGR